MEEILEKFKDLYKGDNILKKHLMLLLVLLIPSSLGCFRYLLDKDTPKELLIPILCILGVLILLSIIPGFTLMGFSADFYNRKIKNKLGLPKINFQTLFNGIKIFPLQFVWFIYGSILFSILFVAPLVSGIIGLTHNQHPSFLAIIGFISGILLLYLISIIIFAVIAPFYSYAYFSFIEDYQYRAEYFNPLLFVKYMKIVFKDTMLVMIKFFVAGILVSTVVGIISGIIGVLGGIFAVSVSMIANPHAVNPMYSQAALLIIIPIATLLKLLSIYTGTMVGLSAGHAYIDIYKKEIRLPDPLENIEKEQENDTPQQEQNNNEGWVE